MKIAALAVFGTVLISAAHAQDYCSLTVRVVDVNGEEVAANIAVEEHDGRRHQKSFSEYTRGGVQFCNLGILPVRVEMWILCSHVVYPSVRLAWGEPRTVTMMAEKLYCEDSFFVGRSSCSFLFRFVDSLKKPIKGVTLQTRAPREASYRADQFGRVMVRIPVHGELRAIAAAAGFIPVNLNRRCDEVKEFEEYIDIKEE